MPQIRRTSMTTVHLELSARIQVMLAHSEYGPVNLDSIFWSVQPATLVTSDSEHNGHSDLGPNDSVASI